jgi:hypothetical protein
MTIDKLRTVLNADPFCPFTISLADGTRYHVPSRDFLWHAPAGRTVIVYHEDDSFSILDLRLIAELVVANGKAGSKDKRRSERR